MKKKMYFWVAGASLATLAFYMISGGFSEPTLHEILLSEIEVFCAENSLTDVECSEMTSTVGRHAALTTGNSN